MEPQHTNSYGSVHGGVIMKNIDIAAAVAACRHARRNCVTASIDKLDFLLPVHVGEIVYFKASVNAVGHTSLEAGVRVEAENLITGDVRYVASAYLTFVALDQNRKPVEVPPLIPENEEDERRIREAELRSAMRHKMRQLEE
ncbi:MAG: acyl-CoA thioesterase [Desulfovibrio sp.]|uniref:acyl-CoA thioesterase n=1 Tax=Desulfovibrio sp. 7SRBS1 TaxID=3378064 RepID=UPI003B40F950